MSPPAVDSGEQDSNARRLAWSAARWWLAAFALWLLLVGQASLDELIVGVVCAAVAVVGFLLVRVRSEVDIPFAFPWLLLVLRRVGGAVFTDSVLVFGAIGRRLTGHSSRGRMTGVDFDPGPDDQPQDHARRAMVLFGLSLAPNTLAVRLDAEHEHIQVHQLVPQPGPSPTDREWPL